MAFLTNFSSWISTHFDYDVKINHNDYTDSLVVEFESNDRIARFVLWDDKSCTMEVVDVSTEKYILDQRIELSDYTEAITCFIKFSNLLES